MKSPIRACIVPTGWPATRCLNAWSRPALPPGDPRRLLPSCPPCPPGTTAPRDDADESVVHSGQAQNELRFVWTASGHRAPPTSAWSAARRIAMLRAGAEFCTHLGDRAQLLELRNLVQVADLIVKSARLPPRKPGSDFSRDSPGKWLRLLRPPFWCHRCSAEAEPGPLGRSPRKGRALKGIQGLIDCAAAHPACPSAGCACGSCPPCQKALHVAQRRPARHCHVLHHPRA